jgi:hypothetical protein
LFKYLFTTVEAELADLLSSGLMSVPAAFEARESALKNPIRLLRQTIDLVCLELPVVIGLTDVFDLSLYIQPLW